MCFIFCFHLDKNQFFIYSIFSEEYSYTFTRFPLKNSEVLVKRENAIKKYDRQGNNWKATQFSRICSKHFFKTDFTNDANRWLKFNVIPSVFNGSQTAATRYPEQDLTSLVNTLVDGSTDLSSSQHLFAPLHDDATISQSIESTVSNTHIETFPADAATRHPEQDLTSLVNTLFDGSTNLSSSQHLFAPLHDDATISQSVESTVSNTHIETFSADAATRHPEQDLTSLVNTLVDGSTDLSSSQHLFAPLHDDATIFQSVESTVPNTQIETFPADAATRHPEQDLTSLVNTLVDDSTDLSSSQHLFATLHDDATIFQSVESTVPNTHLETFPATARSSEEGNLTAVSIDNISPIVPCKKAKFEKDKEISKRDKKIKLLQQKLRRKKSSIRNMKQLIRTLKRKSLINGTEEERLHRKFDGMKRSIFKNLLQNSNISSQSRRYNNSIK